MIVYIDDGIGASKTKALNEAHRDVVVSDLEHAGFVLNIPKSCLEPQLIGKRLGFDLLKGNFHVPDDKLEGLNLPLKVPIRLLESLLNTWLRLSGKLFYAPSNWPSLTLRTRAFINSRCTWSDSVVL